MGSPTEGIVCVQLRLVAAMLIVVYYIYNFIASLLQRDVKRKTVPRTENPIFRQSATQLARAIRRKEISSLAVVAAFIERQQQVNPLLNAIVANRYEEALREAEQVDVFLRQTKQSEAELSLHKPLLGVPMTVKESLSLKGMSLAVGARERIGCTAEEHGAVVRRMIASGAIPLCVTTTPELCLSTETSNLIVGRTNNPYNVNYTSGGSSGGEAALISSGGSVVGIGSDFAGSIRIPSAFCGIFGHKLSTGLIDLAGNVPYSEDPIYQKLLCVGPMCRFAEDLLLLSQVITNDNPVLRLNDPVKLDDLRVYYMLDGGSCFGSMCVHKKIKQRIRDAAHHFKATHNCEVSDTKFHEVQYMTEASAAYLFSVDLKYNAKISVLLELFKTIFGMADISIGRMFYLLLKRDKLIIPNNAEKMSRFVEYLTNKINDELGANGVFFYPVFPTAAFRHGMSVLTYSSLSYLSLANITGLPATTVPVGFTEQGLPIGIQVIAGRNQDRVCLSVAKELETVFGGWTPPF